MNKMNNFRIIKTHGFIRLACGSSLLSQKGWYWSDYEAVTIKLYCIDCSCRVSKYYLLRQAEQQSKSTAPVISGICWEVRHCTPYWPLHPEISLVINTILKICTNTTLLVNYSSVKKIIWFSKYVLFEEQEWEISLSARNFLI